MFIIMHVLNTSVQNGTLPPVGNQGRQPGTSKVHSKNYASPDCGAKIVATNPEAASASNVLSPSRDEYVLNPCTSRIWFVVELCEAIQAKKVLNGGNDILCEEIMLFDRDAIESSGVKNPLYIHYNVSCHSMYYILLFNNSKLFYCYSAFI